MIEVNYAAVAVCGVLAMLVGAIWYGPLFGKKWLEVIKANPADLERRKEMQKGAMKLYLIQFILTLLEVYILAYLIETNVLLSPVTLTLLVWFGFLVPTIAGTAMWNNDNAKVGWTRFLIQSGYQLVIFVIFGFILTWWR